MYYKITKYSLLMWSLFFTVLFGQVNHLTYTTYTIEEGLSSNLIKKSVQDKEGYLWLASDDGLIRFNGENFITFSENLPSNYVKSVICSRSGDLYIATDLGVGVIKKNIFEYEYKNLIRGNTTNSDTTVLYPKSVFEDSKGNLWIGEYRDISVIRDNKFIKYNFSEKYWSDDFSRSYSFTEDEQGNLYAASWQGYIFYFKETENRFVKLNFMEEGTFNISKISFEKKRLMFSSTTGIFEIKFNLQLPNISIKSLVQLNNAGSFLIEASGNMLIGTLRNGLFYFDKNKNSITRLDSRKFMVIKSIDKYENNTYGISSNGGFTLITRKFFEEIDFVQINDNNLDPYIRNINISKDDKLFFTTDYSLFEHSKNGDEYETKRLKLFNNSGIYECYPIENNLWHSYRDGTVLLAGGKNNVLFEYQFENDRLRSLYVDKSGTLWGFLESTNLIAKISDSFQIETIIIDKANELYVQVIKELKDQKIYIGGGTSGSSFLQYYDEKTNQFIPISTAQMKKDWQDIDVFDFDFFDNKIYLATNNGLIVFDEKGFYKKSISEDLDDLTYRSIAIDRQGKIWLGGDRGLILLESKDYCQFSSFQGLPSSTLTMQGLISDSDNNIWIGTAKGLAFFSSEYVTLQKTSIPKIEKIEVISGKVIENYNEFLNNSSIRFNYSTLTYPADRVNYKTRIIDISSNWSKLTTDNILVIPNPPGGEYILEIQANQPGYFSSEVFQYPFRVVPRWFETKFMIILYILLGLVLVASIVISIEKIRLRSLRKKEIELKKLVDGKTKELLSEKEKTEELLKRSEEAKLKLKSANQLKRQLLNVAAHDLKNPLQAILGYEFYLKEEKFDETEVKEILKSIFISSKKMVDLIYNLLESAVADADSLELQLKEINLSKLINETIKENSIRAKQKNQIIFYDTKEDINVKVDEVWFKEAIDNVLSNAVKYSPSNKNIYVSHFISNKNVIIKVKDEGPGISLEDQKKLFKPFKSLSSKPTAGESSTGLGLSVVKEIMLAHNGEVKVNSSKGNGSEFILSLPLD